MAIQEQAIRNVLREVLRECRESPPEDEDNTKFRAIQPLLQTLDYRLNEIRLEDTNADRKRPDYTLLPKDEIHRLRVEAKAWGADLDGCANQTVKYALDDGTNFAVLTDGLSWRLYDKRLPGKPSEMLAAEVCLEDEDDTVRFLIAISKESILSGGLEGFAAAEGKRRKAERLKKVLSEALPGQLADEKSALVGVMCDVLRKQAELVEVSRADLAGFFQGLPAGWSSDSGENTGQTPGGPNGTGGVQYQGEFPPHIGQIALALLEIIHEKDKTWQLNETTGYINLKNESGQRSWAFGLERLKPPNARLYVYVLDREGWLSKLKDSGLDTYPPSSTYDSLSVKLVSEDIAKNRRLFTELLHQALQDGKSG